MPLQQEGSRLIIDSNNRAALIVIVTATGLSWTLLTLIIRVVSRLHVRRSLGLEEILVIAASIAAGISSACVLGSISHGLGRRNERISTKENEIVLKASYSLCAQSQAMLTVKKLLWVSDIFYPVTLSIAKGAALPLLTQLTRIRKFMVTCYALAIFTVLWGVLSILILAARCQLEIPWNDVSAKTCPSLYARWVVIEIGSLLIEILIFIVFLSIIRILKMRRTVKLKVIIAFATRLPVIVPTVFRLIYLRRGLSVDKDTTFALTNAIITSQAVLHYTTMASSFAYLKPFLRAFDSNLGATVKVDTVVSSGYSPTKWNFNEHGASRGEEKGSGHTRSYPMQRLDRNSKAQLESPNHHTALLQPVNQQLTESPSHGSKLGQKTALSSDDRGQQRMPRNKYTSRESIAPMITKTQEWHVITETRDQG